jgi:hydrogenase maturation protein HypF
MKRHLDTGLSTECERSPDCDHGTENRRVSVHIGGIVQGVGFRPYVFQLAGQHQLNGWVRNQPDGVEIEVSGTADRVEAFLHDIPRKAPPLSRIVRMEISDRAYSPLDPFRIIASGPGQSRTTLISPDVCTCGDCLDELFDPGNRRFRYPFINCTNCGPRYTIIEDIPYDRHKTTMTKFAMCAECAREYDNPADRRFHAQPNACWDCGPSVWLETQDGRRIVEKEEAIRKTVQLLGEGAIVAVKGLGGFHLACNATMEAAVSRLRARKVREEKPFAVMFSNMEAIRGCCELGPEEDALIGGRQRPIVLLRKRSLGRGSRIAPSVAPRNNSLGVFLPYTPLHYLLLEGLPGAPLVMTSGNRQDEPIVTENDEAKERLKDIADYFLLHDRDIFIRCDDSVTRMLMKKPRPIRRARGYVPEPVILRDEFPSVLAVGAELKNTICLTRRDEAFLSQHIGDLENLETLQSFEHTISHLQRILEIHPEAIAHDLHPDYLSSQWALRRKDLPRIAVQHHHAHIAAVVAERKLSGPVIGLALDGTGFGTDGTVWGGEILLVDEDKFERLGHFRQVPLPGGNQAVREPWRMAVSYLWSLDPASPDATFEDLFSRWPRQKVQVLLQMLSRRVNSPLTSSCGRLFDAVSSLAGLRDTVNYEGQAAIDLEQAIEDDHGEYAGEIENEHGIWVIDPLPMIEAVVRDLRLKCRPGIIAARFHNGLARLLAEAVEAAGSQTAVKRIALSGGVFQNTYLLERLTSELERRGHEVFTHLEIPANDACIALGQAYIAAHRLMRKART